MDIHDLSEQECQQIISALAMQHPLVAKISTQLAKQQEEIRRKLDQRRQDSGGNSHDLPRKSEARRNLSELDVDG
jgi:uncharacterized protein YfbU (UPF0304 family)